MKRGIVWAALCCLMACGGAHAASGEFVDVEIEVFQSWGFLAWGRWEPLDARYITSRTAVIDGPDGQRLDDVAALCARDVGVADRAACALVAGVERVHERAFAIDADLEKEYRVMLRNRTDAQLGIVLAVDGLNSNGNAPVVGDASDRKWVLRPRQVVRIAGWQVSEDEALQFRFTTPSKTHSPLTDRHGAIAVHVYLPDPVGAAGVRGTEAGELIGQPTVRISFASATEQPVETMTFDYAADAIRLGILCTETDGPGVRVVDVLEGTIAAVKGVRPGDVITYADARPIGSCADLADLLAAKSPGDRIVVKIHREDRAYLLTLELGG